MLTWCQSEWPRRRDNSFSTLDPSIYIPGASLGYSVRCRSSPGHYVQWPRRSQVSYLPFLSWFPSRIMGLAKQCWGDYGSSSLCSSQVLHSLALWQLEKCCSSDGTQFLICETEIWTKQELRGIFVFFFCLSFFCMRVNWGKTKWWQVLGNVSSFSNSRWKWHLESQKLHRRCLTLSRWSSSLTNVWGLECAWYCAMCWTCLRWLSEALWRHLYPHFRDENIEACRG